MSKYDRSERVGDTECRIRHTDNVSRKVVYVVDHKTGQADVRYDSANRIPIGTKGSVVDIEERMNDTSRLAPTRNTLADHWPSSFW